MMAKVASNGLTPFSALKKGASKRDVEKLLGASDNTDNEVIWVYLPAASKGTGERLWRRMVVGDGVLFLIFYKERLLIDGMQKSPEGTPWDCMRWDGKIPYGEVVELLGAEPQAQYRSTEKK
jgi:hypothetical protein